MVSATDGSAFTGSVTVHVTGDGGTQATGSVGSGACTHEGNGFHTYAPAQAETNYDHVAFTFTGTGAIPVTVQIYTTFPQTGDSYARLGAPAGASVSADVASVKTDTAAILTDTGTDGVIVATNNDKTGYTLTQTFPTNFSSLAITAGGAVTAGTVSDKTGYSISGTKTTLDALTDLDAAGVRTAVGLASANLDTQIAALPTAAEIRAEMDSNSTQLAAIVADTNELQTDDVPGLIAALNDISAADVWSVTLTELSADPGASPAASGAVMLPYMAIRNERNTTATTDEISNDAGTTILTASLSDDGTTFTKGKVA